MVIRQEGVAGKKAIQYCKYYFPVAIIHGSLSHFFVGSVMVYLLTAS
jgi:hypothetical protein